MARDSKAATTLESTPPESARMTRSSPTFSRISAIFCSAMLAMDQLGSRPQMSKRKLRSSWLPKGVWRTSGWNCVA